MNKTLIVILVLIGLALILILQNTQSVSLNLFFWSLVMPLVVLVVTLFVLGFIIGFLTGRVRNTGGLNRKPWMAVSNAAGVRGVWKNEKYFLCLPLHFLPKSSPHAIPPISWSMKGLTRFPDTAARPNYPLAQTRWKCVPDPLAWSQPPCLARRFRLAPSRSRAALPCLRKNSKPAPGYWSTDPRQRTNTVPKGLPILPPAGTAFQDGRIGGGNSGEEENPYPEGGRRTGVSVNGFLLSGATVID